MTVAAAASYPFLVGDIGGTNVRFGVLDVTQSSLKRDLTAPISIKRINPQL